MDDLRKIQIVRQIARETIPRTGKNRLPCGTLTTLEEMLKSLARLTLTCARCDENTPKLYVPLTEQTIGVSMHINGDFATYAYLSQDTIRT